MTIIEHLTRTSFLVATLAAALAACDSDAGPDGPPRDLSVAIDVLPGSWPNQTDLDAGGAVEVAILSGDDFDATAVDDATLLASDLEATAQVALAGPLVEADVDGDGTVDVIASVDVGELIEAGILESGRKTRIVVTGTTHDGDTITGWDLLLDSSRSTYELPAVNGPHRVGLVELEWTDATRDNEVGPRANESRRLKVQIWYPADAAPGAQPSPAWLSVDEARFMAESYFHYPPWWDFDLPTDFFDYVSTPAVRDAPIAADAPLPVLIFSHGLGIPTPAQSAIVSDVTSRGFVVVSIYHPYATFPVAFSDGEMVTDLADATIEEALPILVDDMRFVLDQIGELAATDPRFEGALDLNRVGVFGFSLGGAAAAQACADDARFLAGLDIDGTPLGPVIDTGMDQPFMLVNTAAAPNRGNPLDPRPGFLDQVRGSTYILTLPDARHLNFSDFALYLPLMQEVEPAASIPDIGTIDPVLAYRIVNDYIAAFFATYVAGTDDPLLTGESPYSEAVFEEWL